MIQDAGRSENLFSPSLDSVDKYSRTVPAYEPESIPRSKIPDNSKHSQDQNRQFGKTSKLRKGFGKILHCILHNNKVWSK